MPPREFAAPGPTSRPAVACLEGLLVGLLAGLPFVSCAPIGASAQVGYTQMALSGTIALSNQSPSNPSGGGSGTAPQDVGSGFGLGDQSGSPYLRAQVDLGVPVLTASGFWLHDSGTGVLDQTFGGLSPTTTVSSELDLACGKFSCAFDIDLGLLKVAPGLAVDVYDLHFRAYEDALGNSEQIDEIFAVPLLFLRGQASVGGLDVIGEAGYLDTPRINGNQGRFLDLEAMVEWPIPPLGAIFGGYRLIDLDASGDTNSDSFQVNLQIRGWFVGGELRF